MKAFRFGLEKVLDLRRTQLEIEEAKFQRQTAGIAALDQTRAELLDAGAGAEAQVRGARSLTGCDLESFGEFRRHLLHQQTEIANRRIEHVRDLEVQRTLMLEARRRVRLLERLKERRKSEWQQAADKELEETAADSFLARW